MTAELVRSDYAWIVPDDGSFFVQRFRVSDTKPVSKGTLVHGVDGLVQAAAASAAYTDIETFYTPNSFLPAATERVVDNVAACQSMYLDFDVSPTGKTKAGDPCYTSQADALNALAAIVNRGECPCPTLIVDSGRGVHAYWRLTAPIPVPEWVRRGMRLVAHLKGLDPVLMADTSRGAGPADFMRLPGTVNYRGAQPRMCQVISRYHTAHHPEAFPMRDSESLVGNNQNKSAIGTHGGVTCGIEHTLEGCATFRDLFTSHPHKLASNEGWKLMCEVMAADPDIDRAIDLVDQFQQRHFADYYGKHDARAETENYMRSRHGETSPTCSRVQDAHPNGSHLCQSCPAFRSNKYLTPLRAYGLLQQERSRSAVTVTPVAYNTMAPDVEPGLLWGETLPVVASNFQRQLDQNVIPGLGIPVDLLATDERPMGIRCDSELNMVYAVQEGSEERSSILPDGSVGTVDTPIIKDRIVSKNSFFWVDHMVPTYDNKKTSMLMLCIAVGEDLKNYRVHGTSIRMSDALNPRGLQTALNNAGFVYNGMTYMAPMQNYVVDQTQHARRINPFDSFGWGSQNDEDDQFVAAGYKIRKDGIEGVVPSGEQSGNMSDFRVRGTHAGQASILQGYATVGCDESKFLLAAAAGAPLYKFQDVGASLINFYGHSQVGKTDLLGAMQGIWGESAQFTMQGADTENAGFKILARLQHIGGYFDELTLMGEDMVEAFLMQLSQNREKNRLNRDSELRSDIARWNMPLFGTSNRALSFDTDSRSAAGAAGRNRVLDIAVSENPHTGRAQVLHIPDSYLAVARGIHRTVRENTGYIGVAVASELVRNKDLYADMFRGFSQLDPIPFTGAARAAAQTGSHILQRLYPNHWTVKDEEMQSIAERIIARAQETRKIASPSTPGDLRDAFRVELLDLLSEHRTRTVILTRPTPAAAATQAHVPANTPPPPVNIGGTYLWERVNPVIRVEQTANSGVWVVSISTELLQNSSSLRATFLQALAAIMSSDRFKPDDGYRKRIHMLQGLNMTAMNNDVDVIQFVLPIDIQIGDAAPAAKGP